MWETILKLLLASPSLTPILAVLIQSIKNQGVDGDAILQANKDRFTANELREIEHLASLPPKTT